MQIKKRCKKVLLIRSTYDEEKKRYMGKTFCSFNLSEETIPQNVLILLTNKEREKLQLWMQKKKEHKDNQELREAITQIAKNLEVSTKALKKDEFSGVLSKEDAAKIYNAIDALTCELSKLNYIDPNKTYMSCVKKTKPNSPLRAFMNFVLLKS